MVYTSFSNQTSKTQELIDAIAWDLKSNNGIFFERSAKGLAEILGLCPEQNVWLYEPDPNDPTEEMVFATFRLHATSDVTFHLSCKVDRQGNVLEWIGPHDITGLESSLDVGRGKAA
ncbi:MAG: hypothetical protein HKN87_15590 [Saprospiraceae bacterium]|nr:hypothetical protein [Saprospiraceae bacterium]